MSVKTDTIQSDICNTDMGFTDEEMSHNKSQMILRARQQSFSLWTQEFWLEMMV
jgi:hypothetical protein